MWHGASTAQARRRRPNEMTLRLLIFGGLIIFASILFISVVLPWVDDQREAVRYLPAQDCPGGEGRKIYVANGCTYCHTQFVRNIDWGLGAERVARSGDYVTEQPHLLGSERTGPDLSQEGGEHPDDWHLAHYTNPRSHGPNRSCLLLSIWAGRKSLALIAYKQALGFKDADSRVEGKNIGRQRLSRHTSPALTRTWHGFIPWCPNRGRSSPTRTRQRMRVSSGAIEYTRASASDAMDPSATAWAQRNRISIHRRSTSHSEGAGDLRRDPLLPDHERDYRHRHALFQTGAGIGKDLGCGQLRCSDVHRAD